MTCALLGIQVQEETRQTNNSIPCNSSPPAGDGEVTSIALQTGTSQLALQLLFFFLFNDRGISCCTRTTKSKNKKVIMRTGGEDDGEIGNRPGCQDKALIFYRATQGCRGQQLVGIYWPCTISKVGPIPGTRGAKMEAASTRVCVCVDVCVIFNDNHFHKKVCKSMIDNLQIMCLASVLRKRINVSKETILLGQPPTNHMLTM